MTAAITDTATIAAPTEMPAAPLDDATLRHRMRWAGGLYLALFFLGPFAFFYVPDELIVDGDSAATTANIAADTGLFRAGMVAETLIIAIEMVLAGLLYGIFRSTSRWGALASSFARVGEAFVQTVNVLISGAVVVAVTGTGLTAFTDLERADLVAWLTDTYAFGVMLWGVLFGLHLVMLGLLVRRSGFLPAWLGVLLVIAGSGYLAQSWGHMIAPSADEVLAAVVIVLAIPGELALTWLLLRARPRKVSDSPPDAQHVGV